MPYESRILMDQGETLLDICLETHMSITGNSDTLSKSRIARNIDIISIAVLLWKEELAKFKRFDDSVLEMCRAVLEEYTKWRV